MTEPLFTWDASASTEGVAFDELHQRIVHWQAGGFSTADLVDEGNTPDGLFVKCRLEGLRRVRFSPDGLRFVYLCGSSQMGCLETLQPERELITLPFKHKSDMMVLDFFWLPPSDRQGQNVDLVVISTSGLEVFRFAFDQHCAKSHKVFSTSVRMCWVEPTTGMVLVSTSPHTLQPFDFRAKSPKMPKFDLVLGKDQVIEAHDVAVLAIYDNTFCVHADRKTGRVSLRNISNPQEGTPEHDIVIDIALDEPAVGMLRLSTVDNLLVVHCVDRGFSLVYDTRHKERVVVPCICGPCPSVAAADAPWNEWEFLPGNTVIDRSKGTVHRLRIDMGAVLQDFLARCPCDLATVMRLLLRRTSCREHIVRTLRRALASEPPLHEWAQAFSVLNQAYRHSIEMISQRAPTGAGRQTTVSLQELEVVISHQSILSENHMVSQVFHPELIKAASGSGTSSLLVAGAPQDGVGRWRIPLRKAGETAESIPSQTLYMLSVVVAYLRSLLGMQILPHKILQCFVFDLCMYCQRDHTLQQLLHYHVLLDSPEIVGRLQEVATTAGVAWAAQACLDMALRLREVTAVADMLLHTRQYLDVVPFLVSQRVPGFKLHRLLSQIEGDAQAQEDDPDLMEQVLAEIRVWQAEALVPGPAGEAKAEVPAPDLEGCQPYLLRLGPRS